MTAPALPKLPVRHDELAGYIARNPSTPMGELMEPFRKYEAELRHLYAQDRRNPVLDDPHLNVLPLFTQDTPSIKIRARDLEAESPEQKERYIMALPDDKRRPDGSPAVVESLKEFRHNFSIFSESSLADMDWSNVVAAGSSAVNCLLPVPKKYKTTKRALRQFFHERFSPASDIDLFLYGLNEEQAIEKIKQIEASVRDAILSEITVVRTKNAITICSQYPTRHIQIVLRVYKNVSEILTGFDIDCSGAAYDGEQVYCTPRALASYITQINPIDLSRRSPSYENRLSKYSHRNFEVYWPDMDRSRVDPTIFERSFSRTLGLARLLVLERLPTTNAREQYMKKRREERGRPELGSRHQYKLHGNIKDNYEDEVADWVDEDDISNYHTFSVPYGTRFNAKKIEKLCYTKDLLLNAEWNQSDERKVYLHRHPAFFGRVEDVITDCCGFCPNPETPEENEIAEKESEIYVSGKVSFRIDDPGRQQIGSFHPLTQDDWTEMAYVGNTARLCQAIVDGDLEHVEDWLSQEGADPNKRDYTGRTPLHLACTSSTPEIVKCLVDHGARLIPRLADGRTALHLAAGRGSVEIVRILLEKSSVNEEEEADKQDRKRKTLGVESKPSSSKASQARIDEMETSEDEEIDEDEDVDMVDDAESEDEAASIVTGSFVKVGKDGEKPLADAALSLDDDDSEPDFYDIDVVAWDSHCSALHLAILGGHTEVVKVLCQEFAADVLKPVKIPEGGYSSDRVAILTLVLALALPVPEAAKMAETLMSVGATLSQAGLDGITAFHRYVQLGNTKLIDSLWDNDKMGLKTAINHVAVGGSTRGTDVTTPLMSAIGRGDPIMVLRLLEAGANTEIDFGSWLKGAKLTIENYLGTYEDNQKRFRNTTEQPLITAIRSVQPANAVELLKRGADPNSLTTDSHEVINNERRRRYNRGNSALDVVRDCLHKLRKYKGETSAFCPPYRSGFTQSGYSRWSWACSEAPRGPVGTDEFLAKFTEGTYQHWVVSHDIKEAIKAHQKSVEAWELDRKKKLDNPNTNVKAEAIAEIISQLEQVEKALLDKGAKTFKELHPDIETAPDQTPPDEDGGDQKAYEFKFNINGTKDVTAARQDAYMELFEASWAGDHEKIKSMTLSSWADGKEPPLKLAVRDPNGNTPFSLAFLRGHLDVSRAILEIVQAQWSPTEEEKARYRMTRGSDDEDEDESDDEDEDKENSSDEGDPEISKDIIKDQLTIENIGEVAMHVESHDIAVKFMHWIVPTFAKGGGMVPSMRGQDHLLAFAIKTNDMEKFKFFLDNDIYFTTQITDSPMEDEEDEEDEDDEPISYTFPGAQFQEAVERGRVDMLSDAILRTGAGIPLDHLVKKSGVEFKTKHRYYQGLTVYGKKRSDWANAGRNVIVKPTGTQVPPLLRAAVAGSLTSVEWFMSDTPLRLYLEFGKSKAAKVNPMLKHLSQTPGGFDRTITKWLGIQNDMVVHCAVLGPHDDRAVELVKYLLRICPASLEARSKEGFTPLYIAALLGRVKLVRILVEAGADQSVKDMHSENLIHAALKHGPVAGKLRELLDLLDPELRSDLFLQRNRLTDGGDTPVHMWLKTANPMPSEWGQRMCSDPEDETNIELIRILIEYSGGHDLGILNGAGETVLHSAVFRQLAGHMRAILESDPKLLYRENSVGRTPFEIAYDRVLGANLMEPPSVTLNDPYVDQNSYANKEPQYFLQYKWTNNRNSVDGNNDEDGESSIRRKQVWKVAREFRDRFPGTRRLVSLNEANDVARRLGESYTWQRYNNRVCSNDDESDAQAEAENEEATNKKVEEVDLGQDFVSSTYAARRGWVEEKDGIEHEGEDTDSD